MNLTTFNATAGISGGRIVIRNHPYLVIQDTSDWVSKMKENFHFTNSPLATDIEQSHLIITAYSKVAEEAILSGLPIIQWRGIDFEGSLLPYEKETYSASSITELILAHINNYSNYLPFPKLKARLYKDYFYPSSEVASNIAEYLRKHSHSCSKIN
jgi:hypothetical protein